MITEGSWPEDGASGDDGHGGYGWNKPGKKNPHESDTETTSMEEGLQKLSEILHRKGFIVGSPSPGKFILSRGPHEKVTLTVKGGKINIITEDNDDAKPDGDRTFHDEVMGILERESGGSFQRGESIFVGGKVRRLLGWVVGK